MRVRNFVAILLMMSVWQVAAADDINTTFFGNKAIEGYDPVAYFQQDQAVEGKKDFQHQWMGANWYFSSAANRNLFVASPEEYAPQYGGYCAFAVAQNSTAGIDPEQFTIIDNKLYLNYNAKIQKKWSLDRENYIRQADKNWPSLNK